MKKIFTLFFTVTVLTTSVNTMYAQATTSKQEIPKTNIAKSSVTTLYKQLSAYLKTTDAQSQKAIPILTDYDKAIDAIKIKNVGNAGKIQQETNAQNGKTIEGLKNVLNGDQLLKLIFAISMNDNIVNGKNLDANQKAFIAKAKNQYKLSDSQLTTVALAMVEGKLRGDGIALLAKSNPQKATEEFQKLIQDLDGQLKTTLSDEQYKNVKADIEKMIKGQKV